jgi:hypothetical protein
LESLKPVAVEILYQKSTETNSQSTSSSPSSTQSSSSTHSPPLSTTKKITKEDLFYKNIFKNEKPMSQNNLANLFHLNQETADEVESYSNLIKDKNFIETCENSPDFWIKNAEKYPILYKTALVLCSINSSSAFIERFFSICGVINDCRRGNMDKDLFFIRAFLACNIDILNK